MKITIENAHEYDIPLYSFLNESEIDVRERFEAIKKEALRRDLTEDEIDMLIHNLEVLQFLLNKITIQQKVANNSYFRENYDDEKFKRLRREGQW